MQWDVFGGLNIHLDWKCVIGFLQSKFFLIIEPFFFLPILILFRVSCRIVFLVIIGCDLLLCETLSTEIPWHLLWHFIHFYFETVWNLQKCQKYGTNKTSDFPYHLRAGYSNCFTDSKYLIIFYKQEYYPL